MPLILYTVAEALAFLQRQYGLKLTRAALSRHCKIGSLRSSLLGREYLVLEEDLIKFAQVPHSPGRPKKR